MIRRFVFAAAVACAALAFGAEPAAPTSTTFKFNDPNNRDTTTFSLEAPLETINGLSNQLKGQVTVAGIKVSGELRVPIESIKTGNSTRDEHLRSDKWLDAKASPEIVFAFKDVALPAALEPGKKVTLKTKGNFTIHGVTHEEPVEVTATLLKESEETKNRAAGDLLHVKAKFQIPLDTYKIETRRALVLKVGDTADVSVDAWGSTKL